MNAKRALTLVTALALASTLAGCSSSTDAPSTPVQGPVLPLPSTLGRQEYQSKLYAFLGELRYRHLGWAKDKGIRDTGPFKNGKYFGTHPAVKIYYSPEFLAWMIAGRKGDIPDGAMVIKEMYPPPAARYTASNEPLPKEWTVMVRDKAGSVDGWYWAYYGTDSPQAPDNDDPPFSYPNSGFGSYCVRCHGSATEHLTFATLDNVEGFPGEPERYEDDGSWRTTNTDTPDAHPNNEQMRQLQRFLAAKAEPGFINHAFLSQFPQFAAAQPGEVEHLKPESATRVAAKVQHEFMTSDQCMSCHAGDTSPFGPNMVDNGKDLSPWGEWRWSMMGLAGRDPVFYAQMETESTLHGSGSLDAEQVQNLCLHCHGVMGQRQFATDHPGENYTLAKAKKPENQLYHNLSLDGISCTVCHSMADPRSTPLEQLQTGNFTVTPRIDGKLSAFGPFPNPERLPMEQSLAVKPQHAQHITDSRLCASCHTVFLPVIDVQGQQVGAKYEQATYLEWLNSVYRDDGATPKSCQECHMPGPRNDFKIANVQDQDFPKTANQANVQVHKRDGFRRHTLVGANAFVMQMFKDFPDVLGVNLNSFMTGFNNGLDFAIENTAKQVREASGRVDILDVQRAGGTLTTRVKLTNLTGHRFPSGVGFRRVFVEFVVLDGADQVVWGSGRSNALGLIVDAAGNPLPSEFHQGGAFQPHFEVINAENQAQIYEELTQDSAGQFTTSFLSRVHEIKDNRLLPRGWSPLGPASFKPEFAEATSPVGNVLSDANFTDGTGSDTLTYVASVPPAASNLKVRATLYYQAIPPGYLKDRFTQANGPATRRLHFLTSHLDTSKSPFPGWKLQAGQAESVVP